MRQVWKSLRATGIRYGEVTAERPGACGFPLSAEVGAKRGDFQPPGGPVGGGGEELATGVSFKPSANSRGV